MYEHILLGAIQGIAEWLPVSSEGLLILVQVNVFGSDQPIATLAEHSLFLHMGTVLAALLYFRKEVWYLLQTATSIRYWQKAARVPSRIVGHSSTGFGAMDAYERTLSFLVVSTFISGLVGYGILSLLGSTFSSETELYVPAVNGLVGASLVATGILLLRAHGSGHKKRPDITVADSVLLGIVQAAAVVPGLSRSGLTVAALLFKRFEKTTALRLSFLMSIPLVLGGNIIVNLDKFSPGSGMISGLIASFIFGLGTIHLLMKVAERLNFGFFVLVFGILTLIAAFL